VVKDLNKDPTIYRSFDDNIHIVESLFSYDKDKFNSIVVENEWDLEHAYTVVVYAVGGYFNDSWMF